MDLNQLIFDLEEIKSAINEDPERAEDLLGFVIGEIRDAAKQSVQPTLLTPCPYCKHEHDSRLACPEYAAKSQRG